MLTEDSKLATNVYTKSQRTVSLAD